MRAECSYEPQRPSIGNVGVAGVRSLARVAMRAAGSREPRLSDRSTASFRRSATIGRRGRSETQNELVSVASVLVAILLTVAHARIDAQQVPDGRPPAGAAGAAAVAPQFNITPTRLVIPKGQTSASLVLRNDGPEPLRFQVSAFAWSNDADGQIQLQPTTDVVFFPVLFGVEPGQSRRLRVAVTGRAIERELSYRVFIEQLPSRADRQSGGVQMLMRASIPVFVQPPTLIARASIDQVEVASGRASFAVHNVGTVHVSITQVTVRAGHFESKLPGWYLLSGETRLYRVTLPPDVCRERPPLIIAAKFADNAEPLTLTQPIAVGDCEP